MRVMEVREFKADPEGFLEAMRKDKKAITLERDGSTVAALVPVEMLHRFGLVLPETSPPCVDDTNGEPQADTMIDLGAGVTAPGELVFKTALALGGVGAGVWSNDTNEVAYCSEELAGIFGMTPSEYAASRGDATRMNSQIHPDDQEKYMAATDAALSTGGSYTVDYRLLRDTGDCMHIREAGKPLAAKSDRHQFTIGVLQDITDVKRVEFALRANEAELRRAQSLAQVGNWRWDLRGDMLKSCSEEYARIHGVGIDDVFVSYDSHSERFIHPDDRRRVQDEFTGFVQSGQPYRTEYRIIRPDGEVRHLLEIGDPVHDEHGNAIEQTGIIQDITERVRMEGALLRSHDDLERKVRERTAQLAQTEARYRAIFEGAVLGVGRARYSDSAMLLSNGKLASMFAYDDVDEFVSRFVFTENFVDPDDGARLMAAYAADPEQPLECSFFRKDGSIVALEVHTVIDHDEDAIDFICIDITERALAQRAVLEGEGRLQDLLDNSPSLIFIKDIDGRFVFVNKQCEVQYGMTVDSTIGRTVESMSLVPDTVAQATLAHEREVMEGRRAITREYDGLELGDGSRRDVISCKFPLFGLDGEITGIASIVTDVTETKAAVRKLEQAEKLQAMGQLTGGIAHDFNNLLAVIRVNAELLQHRHGEGDRSISAVLRAAACASDLVGRLLSFARRQSLQPRPVAIDALVRDTSDLVARNLGGTIRIESSWVPDLWEAQADPASLQSVLLNLAFNARDAMPEGGSLSFECYNECIEEDRIPPGWDADAGEYVVIAVRDTGTGMSPEALARAFEPFYTTKDVSRGTGLGLSMVYGFVRQSEGHISIDSAEGKGTTVRICLPRAVPVAGANEDKPGRVPAAGGMEELILVVEDDLDLRSALEQMLISMGYRTVSAGDARTAAVLFGSHSGIDLVLTDIMLPGRVSGPEFVAELRRATPDVKAVFMSGYSSASAAPSKRLPADAVVLSKPFHGDVLARTLRQVLDTRSREPGSATAS